MRVALGALALSHRDGHARPTPLAPGRTYRVRLRLPETAHAFLPGHRIRVALGTSYWPVLWPDAEPATLALTLGASVLTLPVRPPDPADAALREFAPPGSGGKTPITVLEPARVRRRTQHDPLTGTTEVLVVGDGGVLGPARRYRLDEIGTVLGHSFRKRCTIRDGDPLSARVEIAQTLEMERGDWRVLLATSTDFTATATEFRATATASASLNGEQRLERRWTIAEKRDRGDA